MKRILIVEDEFGIAEALNDILTEEGHEVTLAYNGRDGLAQAGSLHPDLIILDLMMPIMDGRAMLRAVRADLALTDIPVLIMSAVPESIARRDCDFDAFLQK